MHTQAVPTGAGRFQIRRGRRGRGRGWSRGPPTVPAGIAVFPGNNTIRGIAEKRNTVVHWSEFDRGGHFAPMEAPGLMIGDLREFFRKLRSAGH